VSADEDDDDTLGKVVSADAAAIRLAVHVARLVVDSTMSPKDRQLGVMRALGDTMEEFGERQRSLFLLSLVGAAGHGLALAANARRVPLQVVADELLEASTLACLSEGIEPSAVSEPLAEEASDDDEDTDQ
jgi:hypothetical protein